MDKTEAYRMIDEAGSRSTFYRLIISPDPSEEDTKRDISLQAVAQETMLALEDRFRTRIQWVAATHDDHAPHRHVHILAILPKKLQRHDLQALRDIATDAALFQRKERDHTLEVEAEKQQEQEAQWDLQRS